MYKWTRDTEMAFKTLVENKLALNIHVERLQNELKFLEDLVKQPETPLSLKVKLQ